MSNEWFDGSEVAERGTLNEFDAPDKVHRKSWAHGYQVGLYDAVRYGTDEWWAKMREKVRITDGHG